jgi:hypothetical protein
MIKINGPIGLNQNFLRKRSKIKRIGWLFSPYPVQSVHAPLNLGCSKAWLRAGITIGPDKATIRPIASLDFRKSDYLPRLTSNKKNRFRLRRK